MRQSPIERSRVELCVGDSVRVGDQILTVLDIGEDEATFRVDAAEDFDLDHLEMDYAVCHGEEEKRFPPR